MKAPERHLEDKALKSLLLATTGLFVLVLTSLFLSACGQGGAIKDDAITVDKETPRVDVKILTAKAIKARFGGDKKAPRFIDADAYTQWFYSCKVDFDTEDVFHDDTIGASSMALKIKRVKFKLAMPITVNLPEGAEAALKEHEDGHVQICTIVYGRADSACQEAARQVLGATFNGMGNDPAGARRMALAQARRIVAQSFRRGTSDLADRASRLYDRLCQAYNKDPKMTSLTLAKAACKEFIDRKSTVIK